MTGFSFEKPSGKTSVERLHAQMDGRMAALCGNGSDRVIPRAKFLESDSPDRCKRCVQKLEGDGE
tara:strand:- start:2040 stop:2234 length:195 start_codon:yes stop_codon:yes gene_type:complete